MLIFLLFCLFSFGYHVFFRSCVFAYGKRKTYLIANIDNIDPIFRPIPSTIRLLSTYCRPYSKLCFRNCQKWKKM